MWTTRNIVLVVAGAAAVRGVPIVAAAALACAVGAGLGLLNGMLVAFVGVPSIVATLATMIGLRDALRWTTQGEWVDNLPAGFYDEPGDRIEFAHTVRPPSSQTGPCVASGFVSDNT